MAMLIKDLGVNVYLAMMALMLVDTICGVVNGLVITKLFARFPDPIPSLSRGEVFGFFPVAATVGLLALIIGYILYHHTWLERYVIAIGANREADQLTGINVGRLRPFLIVNLTIDKFRQILLFI